MKIQTHLKPETVKILDRLVAQGNYSSRSSAIRDAVENVLDQQKRLIKPVVVYQPNPNRMKHRKHGPYIQCPNCKAELNLFNALLPVATFTECYYHCRECGYIWKQ